MFNIFAKKNKMKLIPSVFIIALLFNSCQKNFNNQFKIDGTIDSTSNGNLAKLFFLENLKPIAIDSTEIKNGKFTFEGSLENTDLYYISVGDAKMNLPLILENTTYTAHLYADSIYSSEVKGGKEQQLFLDYQSAAKDFKKKTIELSRKYQKAQVDKDSVASAEIKSEHEELTQIRKDHSISFIKTNKDYIFSAILLENFIKTNVIDDIEANELYEILGEKAKNSRAGNYVLKSLNAIRNTKVGLKAPDFSGIDPLGNEISLASYKGKVVILDFWASWSTASRMQNKKLKFLYDLHHNDGLEIISISLDGNPSQKNPRIDWISAINSDSLKWSNISNLKYFSDPIAESYNVKSVPTNFILDRNGVIVAKNLRSEELNKKIEELLKL